jgi:hypothetical protein
VRTRTANIVECYVIRIYRRHAKDAFRAVGVVELPEGDVVKVFHTAGELLEGLDFPKRMLIDVGKKGFIRTGA